MEFTRKKSGREGRWLPLETMIFEVGRVAEGIYYVSTYRRRGERDKILKGRKL